MVPDCALRVHRIDLSARNFLPIPHSGGWGATISRSQAETAALAQVHGGVIKSGGLETGKSKLIRSFDIAYPGTTDIREIAVDAKTGAVLSNDTETVETEAAAADEQKAKRPQPHSAA